MHPGVSYVEQPGSGIRPDQEQSETLESLVCDALRDLELVLITVKASLAALNKSPSGENQQHYLAVLDIQVSQLDKIVMRFQASVQVKDP